MTVRELFEFITDTSLEDAHVDEYLEKIQQQISSRPREMTAEQQNDEEVFKQTFIPRTLNDVFDHERHILQAIDGNTKDMFYNSVVGLSADYQNRADGEDKECQLEEVEATQEKESVDELIVKTEETQDESEEKKEDIAEETPHERQMRLENMDKKERKTYVKELKKEKRQTKTPKHIKKRRKK